MCVQYKDKLKELFIVGLVRFPRNELKTSDYIYIFRGFHKSHIQVLFFRHCIYLFVEVYNEKILTSHKSFKARII